MNTQKVNIKRKIFSVKIRHIIDELPDTSYLGEYSNTATSQFSIDREHAVDCTANVAETGSTPCENCDYPKNEHIGGDLECPDSNGLGEFWFEPKLCTCGRAGDRERNQYRYFNPSFNYVDKSDKLLDGLTHEEVREYVRQDYQHMESLNAGHWYYIGIRAEAEVGISFDNGKNYKLDKLTSGGLWGIESDSGREHVEETEQEELSDLKKSLEAYGFGRSTIAKAFKDVQTEGN